MTQNDSINDLDIFYESYILKYIFETFKILFDENLSKMYEFCQSFNDYMW